jgi:hypothetical protein
MNKIWALFLFITLFVNYAAVLAQATDSYPDSVPEEHTKPTKVKQESIETDSSKVGSSIESGSKPSSTMARIGKYAILGTIAAAAGAVTYGLVKSHDRQHQKQKKRIIEEARRNHELPY